MGHRVKRGDTKTLRWSLGRDLTGVTVTVKMARTIGGTLAINRAGVVDAPATAGIVSLALLTTDYAAGKLEAGNVYLVEIETSPGPLTHPDDDNAYETLLVRPDLG